MKSAISKARAELFVTEGAKFFNLDLRKWYKKILLLLCICVFMNATFAAPEPSLNNTAQQKSLANLANKYSPYADMTINTYWDPVYQDMEPMNLVSISKLTGIQSYHLAFITDSGVCSPAWGGQQSYSITTGWGSTLTDKLRSNLIDYIISFGGASGNDISMSCDDTQLLKVFEQVIKTYQPKGLDFDIENGTADVKKIMDVLKQIQITYPNMKISFTLPVMPEGLTLEGQNVLRAAMGLNYSVNIMAMDYGPVYTGDMGQYAIQAATSLFNYLKTIYPEKSDAALWEMIEVTPMIGVNDVNSEQFTLENVDTLNNFAKQHHLGALSIWSIVRDNPCSDQWASPTCSGKNLQSIPYEFSQHFMQ